LSQPAKAGGAARTGLLMRRVPKVTVTREGDSLCQKGCYPMALLFWFSWSLVSVGGWAVERKLNQQGGEP
jgi:hypothetical protein